jgi:hypothetical protein
MKILTAASVALFVLTIAIWVRSSIAIDVIRYQPRVDFVIHSYQLRWGKGFVALLAARAEFSHGSGLGFETSSPAVRMDGQWVAKRDRFRLLGLHLAILPRMTPMNMPTNDVGLFVPIWMLLFLFAIPPGIWLEQRRSQNLTRKRFTTGCCLQCGYDLRASQDRCPECGTLIVAAAVQSPGQPPADKPPNL